MERFLNIHFTKIQQDNFNLILNDSNDLVIDRNSEYYKSASLDENKYVFSYKLRDTKTVAKVLNIINIVNESNDDSLNRVSYNIYESDDTSYTEKLFQVFRIWSNDYDGNYAPLIESDYNEMDTLKYGTLILDYSGNDLENCFRTNDIDTVKLDRVEQQSFIQPYLATSFVDLGDKSVPISDFHVWCELNKVRDYGYDYTKPKYNLGRIIIGDWIDKEKYLLSDVLEIKKKYPYLLDITIEDE